MSIDTINMQRSQSRSVSPRLWTRHDLARMLAAGIVAEHDRVELIAGEIVRMDAKGARHEVLRNELMTFWGDRRPAGVKLGIETPLALSEHDEPEPDIILFPADLRVNEVDSQSVLLVVEIADWSLSFDLGTKAARYALHGIADYWVIDARTLETTVHRDPAAGRYGSIERAAPQTVLCPLRAPELALRIADLGLEGEGARSNAD